MTKVFVHDEAILRPAFDAEKPSKTQVKAAMHALTDLGAKLLEQNKDRLKQLPLGENLYIAISEGQKITAHGARKRQMQYVGKLMRDLDDATIAQIQEQFSVWEGTSKAAIDRQHLLEYWRDYLLTNDAAAAEFIALAPQTDSQQLRALIRQARKDAQSNKPPKAARELFQLIKAQLPSE